MTTQVQPAAAELDPEVRRDLKTLALFISIYCRYRHEHEPKAVATMRTHDVKAIAGREISLCSQCQKLLVHAWTKRTHCPMDPKPQCKHCPSHCYHPTYRAQIREVMRFSGKKMAGRLDYLFHLLF
jgi:hypothetical protein